MKLSIVVPTKNRTEPLLGCIRSILHQTCQPEELIIVDQSVVSQEDRVKEIFGLKGVKLIYIWDQTIPGLTAARNIGIEKASGNIVLFLDDDVILDAKYVAAILDVYSRDPSRKIGGVGGLITNFRFSSPLGHFSKIICRGPWKNHYDFWYQMGSGIIRTHFLSGCNMSFRKEVLSRFRFDEKLNGICMGEDRFFSYQVSRHHNLFMTAEARLQHLVSPISRKRERDMRAMSFFSNYYFF